MARSAFTLTSLLLRWIIALVLVFATFNPTDYSYFRWVAGLEGESLPLKALAGTLLLILYVIYLRAAWRSIGSIGFSLAATLPATLIWVSIDFGLLNLMQPAIMTWVLLFAVATILAVGIYWLYIHRRITIQADIDDVDERQTGSEPIFALAGIILALGHRPHQIARGRPGDVFRRHAIAQRFHGIVDRLHGCGETIMAAQQETRALGRQPGRITHVLGPAAQ